MELVGGWPSAKRFGEKLYHTYFTNYSKIKPEIQLRTCLWGFSQGGAASLTYTLLGTHSLFKIASICGFLPELPDQVIEKKQALNILGIFGSNDEVVPSFLADYALDEMKSHGHVVESIETSQSHEVNAENLQSLGTFFSV
jgi:predicted esterase